MTVSAQKNACAGDTMPLKCEHYSSLCSWDPLHLKTLASFTAGIIIIACAFDKLVAPDAIQHHELIVLLQSPDLVVAALLVVWTIGGVCAMRYDYCELCEEDEKQQSPTALQHEKDTLSQGIRDVLEHLRVEVVSFVVLCIPFSACAFGFAQVDPLLAFLASWTIVGGVVMWHNPFEIVHEACEQHDGTHQPREDSAAAIKDLAAGIRTVLQQLQSRMLGFCAVCTVLAAFAVAFAQIDALFAFLVAWTTLGGLVMWHNASEIQQEECKQQEDGIRGILQQCGDIFLDIFGQQGLWKLPLAFSNHQCHWQAPFAYRG